MVKDNKSKGFGIESIDDNYFVVDINESLDKIVVTEIFELQYLDEDNVVDDTISKEIVSIKSSILSKTLKTDISKVMNKQLKESNLKKGSWNNNGKTYFNKFLGKELILLLWAIEECNNSKDIKAIFDNWKILKPTERWWLYTMINNEIGNSEFHNQTNWKSAIKIALLPVNN